MPRKTLLYALLISNIISSLLILILESGHTCALLQILRLLAMSTATSPSKTLSPSPGLCPLPLLFQPDNVPEHGCPAERLPERHLVQAHFIVTRVFFQSPVLPKSVVRIVILVLRGRLHLRFGCAVWMCSRPTDQITQIRKRAEKENDIINARSAGCSAACSVACSTMSRF
jgi:hypothetical protein